MNFQTLYMNELILPTMTSLVGERRSSYIYLKGIKIDRLTWSANDFPAFVHFAIVQDRDNNNSDLDREQNFFRDTTSLTARAHPFNNWAAGSALDRRQHFNPINSDHYNVITHKKFVLGAFPNDDQNRWFRAKSEYYKINRRIAFDNVTDTVNWRPFYICFWWQVCNPADHSTVTANNQIRYQYKTEVVFKNIL